MPDAGCLIPADFLRPGDVILSDSGKQLSSIAIKTFGDGFGRFTHAGIVGLHPHTRLGDWGEAVRMGAAALFESEDHGVGETRLPGTTLLSPDESAPSVTHWVFLKYPKGSFVVLRPLALDGREADRLAQEVTRACQKDAYLPYPPWRALAEPTKFHGPFKLIPRLALRAFEVAGGAVRYVRKRLFGRDARGPHDHISECGPFCSQYVTRVLRSVGADPFPDGRDDAMVSPNNLRACPAFRPVKPAVVLDEAEARRLGLEGSFADLFTEWERSRGWVEVMTTNKGTLAALTTFSDTLKASVKNMADENREAFERRARQTEAALDGETGHALAALRAGGPLNAVWPPRRVSRLVDMNRRYDDVVSAARESLSAAGPGSLAPLARFNIFSAKVDYFAAVTAMRRFRVARRVVSRGSCWARRRVNRDRRRLLRLWRDMRRAHVALLRVHGGLPKPVASP